MSARKRKGRKGTPTIERRKRRQRRAAAGSGGYAREIEKKKEKNVAFFFLQKNVCPRASILRSSFLEPDAVVERNEGLEQREKNGADVLLDFFS